MVTAAVVAGFAVWVVPYTPAREWPGAAQVVAIDKPIVLALAIVAAVACVRALTARRHRGSWWALAGGVLVVIALFTARVAMQGVDDGPSPSAQSSIVAVSWNAHGEDATHVAEQLFPLIERYAVDVVVLPETAWKNGDLVREELKLRGFEGVGFAPQSTATSVVLAEEFATHGRYELDEGATPPWAGLTLVPERPSKETPIILATHIQQPSPGNVGTWTEHLDWVARMCDRSPFVVVIGDLNSTLNNLAGNSLGACRDVAEANGAGAAATWPTGLPPWLGVAIDRFLVGAGFDPSRATFHVVRDVEVTKTDHWPILVSF